MDIVDGQVHANVLGTETALAIMDAIGIQAVMIDEFLGMTPDGALQPGYEVASGVSRPIGPNAEAAALRFPDRFSYLMRINPFDPSLEAWLETLAASPNFRAVRTIVFSPAEGAAFEAGGYDRLFAAADRHGMPVFVTCPGRVRQLAPYVEKFSGIQFVIDHCGAAFDAPKGGASIADTLVMARYPNVALKWAHAPSLLSLKPYPFPDLETKLVQAMDAFGRERILWASDYTVSRDRQSWAEALFYLRHSPSLSASDKEWVLGRTLRRLLRWPAPATQPTPAALHFHG